MKDHRWANLLKQKSSINFYGLPVCRKQTEVSCFLFPLAEKQREVAVFRWFRFSFAESGNIEPWRWRHGNMKKKQKMEAQAIYLNPFTVCSSCKRKFVICPLVD
jgi:hypothetical protein